MIKDQCISSQSCKTSALARLGRCVHFVQKSTVHKIISKGNKMRKQNMEMSLLQRGVDGTLIVP